MARPTHISRALSQNFLADRATAEYVARLAVPQGRQVPLLLEVGAGKGALTAKLAPHCDELHAHEIDPRLVPKLRTRFSTTPQVHVVAGDFMDTRPPRTPFSVAGNVPFSRTADIVDWCLRAPGPHRRHPPHPARIRPQTHRGLRQLDPADGAHLASLRVAAGRPGRPAPVQSRTARRRRDRTDRATPDPVARTGSAARLAAPGRAGLLRGGRLAARLPAPGPPEAPRGRRVPGRAPRSTCPGGRGVTGPLATAARGADVVEVSERGGCQAVGAGVTELFVNPLALFVPEGEQD